VRLFQGLGQTGVLIRNLGATGFCFQLWLVYVLHTSVKLCNLTFPHLSQWYFIAGTLVARCSLQRWQMTYFCFLSVILHMPTHSDCGVSTWGGGGVEEKKGDKGETKTWVKFVINLQSHTTLLFHVAMVISRPI